MAAHRGSGEVEQLGQLAGTARAFAQNLDGAPPRRISQGCEEVESVSGGKVQIVDPDDRWALRRDGLRELDERTLHEIEAGATCLPLLGPPGQEGMQRNSEERRLDQVVGKRGLEVCLAEKAAKRIKNCAGLVDCAARRVAAEEVMALDPIPLQLVKKLTDQPRLANPRLACQEQYRAPPGLDLGEAFAETIAQ